MLARYRAAAEATTRKKATLIVLESALVAAVAQLDRVLGYEPRGRGFNSCQPHQNFWILEKQPEVDALGCFSLWVSFRRESGRAELNSRTHEAELQDA